jgi:hypothetical protein
MLQRMNTDANTFITLILRIIVKNMAARPQRHPKPLPKLPVARRRNRFEIKHAPATNLYRGLTCETRIAPDAQIRAANINPTSVLRKFTFNLPSWYTRKPSESIEACCEASQALPTFPSTFDEVSSNVDGTIRQNKRPRRLAS